MQEEDGHKCKSENGRAVTGVQRTPAKRQRGCETYKRCVGGGNARLFHGYNWRHAKVQISNIKASQSPE